MKELVSIKGIRDKLLMQVSCDLKAQEIAKHIDEKLSQESVDCWKDSSLILNTGTINLTREELKEIRKLFEDKYGMYFSELQSLSKNTRKIGRKMGWIISTGLEQKPEAKNETVMSKDTSTAPENAATPTIHFQRACGENHGLKTEYIRRTVRSGSRIDSTGNIIVLGDVNPGSEIYACGDVIVFGALKGAVFSGVGGNENAVIVALKMQPVQIGIGHYLSRAPDITDQDIAHPEIARIENGHIIIESFKSL